MGWIVPQAWWSVLAIAGAGMSLLMLVVYLHPLYAVGLASNLAVLVSMLWVSLPEFMQLPA